MNGNSSLMEAAYLKSDIPIKRCLPVEDEIPFISPQVRLSFASIYGMNMLVEFPVNVLVICLIFATNQHENQSTRLILYASILDSFGAISYNSIYIIYMMHYEQLSCTVILLLNSVASYSIIGSAFLAVMVAFDRFIRIKYLNDYQIMFTRKRHYQAMIVISMLASIQVKLYNVKYRIFFDIFIQRSLTAIIMWTVITMGIRRVLVSVHLDTGINSRPLNITT